MASHNCNSLMRVLLLLFNVFTTSDCVTNYKIVEQIIDVVDLAVVCGSVDSCDSCNEGGSVKYRSRLEAAAPIINN